VIRTEGLSKVFETRTGPLPAVESLNLQVNEGEVFGFLGPNGAGKTTTVRMLACLIAPTAGRAWVNGLEVGQEDTRIRGDLGILTETPGLYDRLSTKRNLSIFAELYDVEDVPGQVEKYLRLLGLWDRRDSDAGTLSKGMRQKLAIARALLHEPPVLFLDEPTSGLDPEAAKTVRDFIETLRGQGRTIFLCTHNLDEAERLCDRIGVFRQRLIAVDTPDALRRQLFGRQTVVHLARMEGAFVEAVRALPFVQGVDVVDGGDGSGKLLIGVQDPTEQNPEIVRVLAALGAQIQFVNELRHSLESVYLSLLENDANGKERKA
jgi:ABC-2 type transport system ATP-binding protein